MQGRVGTDKRLEMRLGTGWAFWVEALRTAKHGPGEGESVRQGVWIHMEGKRDRLFH